MWSFRRHFQSQRENWLYIKRSTQLPSNHLTLKCVIYCQFKNDCIIYANVNNREIYKCHIYSLRKFDSDIDTYILIIFVGGSNFSIYWVFVCQNRILLEHPLSSVYTQWHFNCLVQIITNRPGLMNTPSYPIHTKMTWMNLYYGNICVHSKRILYIYTSDYYAVREGEICCWFF